MPELVAVTIAPSPARGRFALLIGPHSISLGVFSLGAQREDARRPAYGCSTVFADKPDIATHPILLIRLVGTQAACREAIPLDLRRRGCPLNGEGNGGIILAHDARRIGSTPTGISEAERAFCTRASRVGGAKGQRLIQFRGCHQHRIVDIGARKAEDGSLVIAPPADLLRRMRRQGTQLGRNIEPVGSGAGLAIAAPVDSGGLCSKQVPSLILQLARQCHQQVHDKLMG